MEMKKKIQDVVLEKEEEPPPKQPSLQPFAYISPFGYYLVCAILLSGSITLLNLCPPQIIRYIINTALPNKETKFLATAVAVMVVLFVIRGLLMHLRTRLVSRMGEGIVFNLRAELLFHLQRLSFSFYDRARTGTLLSRVTSDTAYIQQFFTSGSHVFAVAVLTSLGVTVICLTMNWKLTLFAMLPIPALIIMISNYSRVAKRIYRVIRRQWGSLTAHVSDDLSGIKEIKSFAQEDFEDRKFWKENRQTYKLGIKVADLSSIYEPVIVFVSACGTILVVGFGGLLTIRGEIKAGELVAFLLYLALLYQPIWQLNSLVNLWEHARASAERISRIMSVPREVYQSPGAVELEEALSGEVVFEHVSFSYGQKKILKDINFAVRKGEKVALVGATGAGKTTVVNLIPRFYDADDGEIRIDGHDVKKLRLDYLRGNIGIVLQEPFLFSCSIRENIIYGKPDASEKEIAEAAEAANADRFVSNLSGGYQSNVGERGTRLSVGEKQRIAIARVLIKNPPILILDEATSALDSETEKLVQEALDRLMWNRTTFIIAHRLSTVRNADRIMAICDGELAEQGTHEELLLKGGVYAELYETQFEQSAVLAA